MRLTAILGMLSLLIGGAAFVSTNAEAAAWISGSDSYAAPWVKDIGQELMKNEYRYVFGNHPRTPQTSVLRLLSRAALAYQANETAQAEQLVQDALNNLMQHRTSVVIAHRLSTIQHADEILVVQDGRIVERGRHEELVRDGGLYQKLQEIQKA